MLPRFLPHAAGHRACRVVWIPKLTMQLQIPRRLFNPFIAAPHSIGLHPPPRFSWQVDFLPRFLPNPLLEADRTCRKPLRKRPSRYLCSRRADHSSKLVMRVRFPSSALQVGWLREPVHRPAIPLHRRRPVWRLETRTPASPAGYAGSIRTACDRSVYCQSTF